MNFEPQKLFISLMDFFSILLPAASLTYLFMDEVGPVVLRSGKYQELAGSEAWAVFLLASYVCGHLVFLLGSWLDELYDWFRGYMLNTQIALLARRGRLLPSPIRALISLVFRRERNRAVDRAARSKPATGWGEWNEPQQIRLVRMRTIAGDGVGFECWGSPGCWGSRCSPQPTIDKAV